VAAQDLKSRIEEFLASAGVEYDAKHKKYRCPNPGHADEHASAHLYRDTNLLYCPVCSASWDIYDVAGLVIGEIDFPARARYVENTLGVAPVGPLRPAAPRAKKKEPVALSRDRARAVYTREEIQRRGTMAQWGTFSAHWPFLDERGDVLAMDVRFDRAATDGGPGKSVITFWYDGAELRTQGAPVLLYGRDQLAARPSDPVLVVEGCKTAEAAARIPGFVAVTWNGGTGKAGLPDWSPLAERVVYVWPDDDQKTDASGTVKPAEEQPGIKAAIAIRKTLPHARIITPPPEARKIKADGADAVEALEVFTPEELAAYIIAAPPAVPEPTPRTEKKPQNTRDDAARKAAKKSENDARREQERKAREEVDARDHNPTGWPFTILGVADDGRMGVIGRGDRLDMVALAGLTKTNLLNFAPIEWWIEEFGYDKHGGGRGISWDAVISYVIGIGRNWDFDASQIRGRGAWRERDGRICYHDGRTTIGDVDARRLYVRRPVRDIGIRGAEIDSQIAKEIEQVTSALTFETPIDHVRLMGWSLLAPFAGALPWRPALLLTGDSGSGKSTIIDFVAARLSEPLQVSGGESTEAGVRQKVGIDACGIVIDEAECDTEKKRRNREALFSLMRQSTSDDAPIVAKGTMDGKGLAFQMRSMFLFAAISPDITAAADDNRIFRINLRRPDSTKWPKLRDDLRRLVTSENCTGMRARTWNRLSKIIETAHRFAGLIQDVSGRDARYSLAEGILQSAYWIVLRARDGVSEPELTDDEFRTQIASLYSGAPQEQPRDENEEMLDRILDSSVTIDEPRRSVTLREVLLAVRDGRSTILGGDGELYGDDAPKLSATQMTMLRGVAGRHGLSIVKGALAVACNHDALMQLLDRGRGYHRQLLRHDNLVDRGRVVNLAGKSRYCVILSASVLGEQPTAATRATDDVVDARPAEHGEREW
jgi:hypothetical protein